MKIECKYMVDGQCVHADQPYGSRPSRGVCLKACQKYEGPPRGLGDVVEVVTRITGIKAITQAVAKVRGKPCNCGKRRIAMNEAVPFENCPDCKK